MKVHFLSIYIYIYILVLIEESKDSIKNAVKKNDEGFPIFDESIGWGIPDGVNTLIYTVLVGF